ncbi:MULTISPECIES: EI24 domain-containing protein [unclassified Microbacterium]|uniref:EI24 domain-containing protein n=1 Tax=unclassified Microbacterium TaxID=2609290 RepID=UPI002BB1480A|nr:EI24 domain-containing protein [Microbacterium sp.]HWK78447.1 EI24 domain-containing protein [Microbacterium sp.]
MFREFFAGVGTLLRGFRMWKTHTRLMALGLIPAFIAWAVLLAAIIPLLIWLGPITDWMTPFADGWSEPWQALVRFGLGAVIIVAALALAAAVFTALTLTIGDPFYQRIWRGIERSLGEEPTGETGFWSTVGEGIRLVLMGLLVALLTLLIGFIPVIGGIAATVIGVLLNGRVLARELTGRAFDARGLTGYSRSGMLRAGRARVIGFGVATQLCFLVPFGAIVTMPAAVAGSTLLAHDLLRRAKPGQQVAQGVVSTPAGRREATPPVADGAPAPVSPPPPPPGYSRA